jgi:hypothetical protein
MKFIILMLYLCLVHQKKKRVIEFERYDFRETSHYIAGVFRHFDVWLTVMAHRWEKYSFDFRDHFQYN